MRKINRCKNCNRDLEIHAHGLCISCYKKLVWKPKIKTCKRCGREMRMHAKGLCDGCYNFVFHLDKNKAYNYRKWHNIDLETYRKIIKECVICGFDKVVDLHHLDGNKKNSSETNLVGLCPNHHKMLHDFRYRKEVVSLLKEKGYNAPIEPKLDFKIDN